MIFCCLTKANSRLFLLIPLLVILLWDYVLRWLCGIPLLKKKTTTHLGQFRESTG